MILPIEIKRIFLQFLQGYFSESSYLKWDYDVTKTKIIITDRHAFDIGVATKRPSIIVTRGDLGWTFAIRGQDGTNTIKGAITNLGGSGQTAAPFPRVTTDLIRGSITFNVISKNGIQAETIANTIFTLLSSFKKELISIGIHQYLNLSIGSEQLINSKSDVELIGVQVNLSFLYRYTLVQDERLYNIKVFVGEEEVFEGEYSDFTIGTNGTVLNFNTPLPENKIVKVLYVDSINLDTNQVEFTSSGESTFTIPGGAAISGYYKVSNANQTLDLKTISEIEGDNDYRG